MLFQSVYASFVSFLIFVSACVGQTSFSGVQIEKDKEDTQRLSTEFVSACSGVLAQPSDLLHDIQRFVVPGSLPFALAKLDAGLLEGLFFSCSGSQSRDAQWSLHEASKEQLLHCARAVMAFAEAELPDAAQAELARETRVIRNYLFQPRHRDPSRVVTTFPLMGHGAFAYLTDELAMAAETAQIQSPASYGAMRAVPEETLGRVLQQDRYGQREPLTVLQFPSRFMTFWLGKEHSHALVHSTPVLPRGSGDDRTRGRYLLIEEWSYPPGFVGARIRASP